ncbi:MAG: hypothetical protein L3K19_00780 [Thermoplasmata archaeon]|nr:hypothetical protein [Thermoplasmata archaeon]
MHTPLTSEPPPKRSGSPLPGTSSRWSIRRRSTSTPLGRPWWPWAMYWAVLGVAVVSFAAVAGVLPTSLPSLPPVVVPPSNASTGAHQPACYPYGSPTPSAVLVPIAPPTQPLAAGGALSVQFEIGAMSYPAAARGVVIDVPSAFANFPQAAGGTAQVYFSPSNFSVTGAGWTNAYVSNRSVVESSGVRFATNRSAVLSTEKIAVEGNAPYGAVTLAVRWHWALNQPNGSTVTGPWSVPTNTSQWPSSIPSEFYPAPSVTVLSSSGPSQWIGANYSARLGGIVSARYFFLELESPATGKVVQDHGQTAPNGASNVTVSVPLLNYNRYLYPGTYLVHIHDVCGALLASVAVNASYTPWATVQVHLQPSSCGKVTFNGTGYGNGSTITTRPSSTPYSFTLPGCPGHAFTGWQFSGGLFPTSSHRLLVSSNGSFVISYA